MEIKATHIPHPTPGEPLKRSDIGSIISASCDTEWWYPNWVVVAGDILIFAESNGDAVDYAAKLADAAPANFDGRIRPGMRRKMREKIAAYLNMDWREIYVLNRIVNADTGYTYTWW